MSYQILADITVVFHLFWILFLVFGVIPGLKIKWIRIAHLSGLGFSIILQIKGWYCPLTYLESWLRGKAGWTYSGSFIRHYVEELVYLDVSRTAIFIGTLVVVGLTVWLYVVKVWRREITPQ
jgi:hypothetical protein